MSEDVRIYPELFSARLRLRPLRSSDEEFLAGLDADPTVMEYIHNGVMSRAAALRFARSEIEMAAFRRSWGKWLVELRNTVEAVGWVWMGKLSGYDRDDLQIGYEFAPAHWNHGYATEAAARVVEYAFQEVQMDRVAAIARPDNMRSVRVLAKLGFQIVGKRRDEGRNLCDEFRLTMEQWQSGKPK